MQLMMYLGNDLIEAIEVNRTHVSEPGYLGRFKRMLRQKHWDEILQSGTQPEYLVVNAVTAYNNPPNAGMSLPLN